MTGPHPQGRTCDTVQQQLEERLQLGQSLTPELGAHLQACRDCRVHLALLRELEAALLEDVPVLEPPTHLKTQLLSAARRTQPPPAPARRAHPSRRVWPLMLGAAAVSGLLAFGALLTPSRGTAATLPDPAVVVASADGLLVASNDRGGTLSLLRGDRVTASLRSDGAQPAFFTQGVRLGDRVYLADAANDRVLEVQTDPLSVVRTYRVPDGVAGLTASGGPDGGRVYFKTVRGSVGQLRDGAAQSRRITVARKSGMPLADVMDGVLMSGGRLYVTHHLSGEICLLDPDTLMVLKRVQVGGAPVDLAPEAGGTLLALDLTGRLLRLNAGGEVIRSWPLPGHPDKLGVNGSVALVTDRAGQLTRIDLIHGNLRPMPLAHPMDVVALNDGTFAVAEGNASGQGGVRVLDDALKTSWQMRGRR